jgi:hypothetical protein
LLYGVTAGRHCLESYNERRSQVDILNDVVRIGIRIVADEDPARTVGGESEVGFELAATQPVFHLADAIVATLEVLADRLGFDQEAI